MYTLNNYDTLYFLKAKEALHIGSMGVVMAAYKLYITLMAPWRRNSAIAVLHPIISFVKQVCVNKCCFVGYYIHKFSQWINDKSKLTTMTIEWQIITWLQEELRILLILFCEGRHGYRVNVSWWNDGPTSRTYDI